MNLLTLSSDSITLELGLKSEFEFHRERASTILGYLVLLSLRALRSAPWLVATSVTKLV